MKREKKSRRTKRAKRQRKSRVSKHKIEIPRTAQQYFAMSQKEQETWDSVTHVISEVRNGALLPNAAIKYGVDPDVVISRGRPVLRKKNGRYVATKTDRLLRILTILTVGGKKEIATRDSRQASMVGSHWAAVQRYLQTGDDAALLRFKGEKVIDASGKRHLLLTDLKELDRQASAGVLSFESIYPGGS